MYQAKYQEKNGRNHYCFSRHKIKNHTVASPWEIALVPAAGKRQKIRSTSAAWLRRPWNYNNVCDSRISTMALSLVFARLVAKSHPA